MSRTRQHYTPEFKFQVVLEVLREEQTVAEITVKHQIHPCLITRWKAEFSWRLESLCCGDGIYRLGYRNFNLRS